jgi:PAB-dependent poly(A)-specific ribonuclease subunit 3
VSLGHVVDTLNRLDVGTPEKIPLVSRDHKTVLLCSFQDLKKAVDQCFGELVKKQGLARPTQTQDK